MQACMHVHKGSESLSSTITPNCMYSYSGPAQALPKNAERPGIHRLEKRGGIG